jgi:hypothetical protein
MARPHLEHVHSPELSFEPVGWPGWPAGAVVKELSRDAESGAVTSLLELPAGYRMPAGSFGADRELLVLEGSLRIGGDERRRLYYDFAPSAAAVEPLEAPEGAVLLLMARTGPPDFSPGAGAASEGRVQVDPDELRWEPNPFADGPPGARVLVLRHVPETGEMSALVRDGTDPYPVYEFHDCVEEVFMIEGDLTLGNSGEMRAGSYFWRPEYITHGLGTSESGSFYYVYVDKELVNHRTDGFHRTPEENRRQVESARTG